MNWPQLFYKTMERFHGLRREQWIGWRMRWRGSAIPLDRVQYVEAAGHLGTVGVAKVVRLHDFSSGLGSDLFPGILFASPPSSTAPATGEPVHEARPSSTRLPEAAYPRTSSELCGSPAPTRHRTRTSSWFLGPKLGRNDENKGVCSFIARFVSGG